MDNDKRGSRSCSEVMAASPQQRATSSRDATVQSHGRVRVGGKGAKMKGILCLEHGNDRKWNSPRKRCNIPFSEAAVLGTAAPSYERVSDGKIMVS